MLRTGQVLGGGPTKRANVPVNGTEAEIVDDQGWLELSGRLRINLGNLGAALSCTDYRIS